jgi:heptosyltransferase-1
VIHGPLDPAREHRILLVRTSALGDIVHALPVLAALERALPKATLAWVVDEAFAPLLDRHAWLDRVIPVPLRRWRRGGSGRARELGRFVRELRRFRADVAIDLMGNHKGALLARLSGARRRIGARAADRREPSSALWTNLPVAVSAEHAVERALALLAPLGVPVAPVDFGAAALACGRELVPAYDYLYLHPGAAWGNKRYPPVLWGQAAAELARATRLPVEVGAAPGEEGLADAVVAASGGAARRFDAPTLAHLAGALRGARLVLAGDTGATHLARAFGVGVVAVHGPTDPARHGPWGAPESAVYRRLPCSFCHRAMAASKACLESLPPRFVVERALAVLSGERGGAV